MKRFLLPVALVAIFLFGVATYELYQPPTVPPRQVEGVRTIQLHGQTVRVSVADTEVARERGLSDRPGLAADEGMLFVFPRDGKYGFWMKDMHFSIDIMWLSADQQVVYMAQNISPDTYPQVFRPNVLARYVLELPAGYAKEYTVTVGDKMTF
ncbi:DUF192 domain-containing protein [Candidatus Kaiserbacteria bacterium]|nr:DUF192 domain-containing protein [Candidatus Kaiserbacteria bacterium]